MLGLLESALEEAVRGKQHAARLVQSPGTHHATEWKPGYRLNYEGVVCPRQYQRSAVELLAAVAVAKLEHAQRAASQIALPEGAGAATATVAVGTYENVAKDATFAAVIAAAAAAAYLPAADDAAAVAGDALDVTAGC